MNDKQHKRNTIRYYDSNNADTGLVKEMLVPSSGAFVLPHYHHGSGQTLTNHYNNIQPTTVSKL